MKTKVMACITLFATVTIPIVLGSQVSFAAGESGSWTQHAYKNQYGQRNYYVYVPMQARAGRPLPLLVMLHGCTQSAADFAKATKMNALADQKGFVVLYPEQDSASNSSKCWNWYSPDNFTRGGGELGIVMGMIGEVQKSLNIDRTRVAAAGFSAGAGLASNLLACHSDTFSSVVVHAGLEYKAATSLNDAYPAMSKSPSHDLGPTSLEAARCAGPSARISRLLVIQGKSDTIVNPKNADRIVDQFSRVNDLLDDGQDNNTQNTDVLRSQGSQVPGGRSYQFTTYGGKGQEHIAKVLIDGMGHAWSGGSQRMAFTDPQGPSASEMVVELLVGQP